MAPPFASHHGETLERTVDVARRLSDGRFRSAPGFNVPGFRYIDRELDVMRTSAGQMLDDGSPAKRALVLDLLLASADDGRPIVTEVKIRTDGHADLGPHPGSGCGSASRHAAQRARLGTIYGEAGLAVPPRPPYADVAVLLIDPPDGTRVEIIAIAKALGAALEQSAAFGSLIRRIHSCTAPTMATARSW
jgi:hypothetical protein